MDEEIKTLKIASCPSLSARSILKFEIGCDGQQTIFLRITENSGSGIFSKAWIPLNLFGPLLTSEETTISAKAIRSLFQGKSVNTSTFFVAALITEGLLKIADSSQRSYLAVNPSEFTKKILALCDNSPPIEEKPAKEKKPASKKSENPA